MNFPLYIARRIAKNEKGSFSSTIHRIAIISIALSMASLIVSFFVLYGFKDAIREKVYNLSGHLTIDKYALSTSYEENFITVSDSIREALLDDRNIEHVQEFVLKAGLLKTNEEVQGIVMKGVGEDFNRNQFEGQMVRGGFPTYDDDGYSADIVISGYLSRLLRLDVEDQVTLFFLQEPPRYRRVTVSGIYTTGLEEFDGKIIFGDIDLIRRINGWNEHQLGGMEVILKDYRKMDRLEEELFNSLPVDLNVTSANRQYAQIFEWLQLLNRNVVILLLIVLAVSILGMTSMVLILIMERTRMIGMLKAMGMPNSELREVFVISGLNLVFKGLLIGNVFGLLVCWVQFQFQVIPLDVSNYYMHFVPVTFDWTTLFLLNAVMTIIIGLTLLIPVQLVTSIRPLKAIRFD